ncbi:sialate O-acetylesterase [Flavihumibacter cheonanensis]|uniref:sialate O-acetylesterase n=1 Tax=Flavihumibacter cheonanensis TaxID=1442385 RepID=UPI001EF820C6|nr:sialate O-acetylesterase [Flavihumibacter cheonanensis]MCG7752682.1 sialate O-acetylesterase [Flavihumibacter cheonanensis]
MKFFILSVGLLLSGSVFGQLQLADCFANHMVIQRSKPFSIWGKAVPGLQLKLQFNGFKGTTTVQQDSSWKVDLPSMPANSKATTMFIKAGKDSVRLINILVGDVWICTGQSNMEWAFSREEFAKKETPDANQPFIRLYNTRFIGKYIYGEPYADSLTDQLQSGTFYSGTWEPCTSETVQPMSAVAYYFAKRVTQQTGIPIGIINLAIGGAPLETFISQDAMVTHPVFQKKLDGNWLYNSYLPTWIRERGLQNIGHLPTSQTKTGEGPNHAYKPGFAYAAAIPQFSRLPIAGILLYQGESNSLEPARVFEYGSLLTLMVKDYRAAWKDSRLPFYWVQLSSIDTLKYQSAYWPAFRNIQREQLDSIPYSGMAVSSDIGHATDVHPRNKRSVGYRLANWALHYYYCDRQQSPSGPLFKNAKLKSNRLELYFSYSGKGLTTSDDQPIRGFSFDGTTNVAAILKRKKVVLPFQHRPVTVYYGWQPYSIGNLVNSEGMPASTFTFKLAQ